MEWRRLRSLVLNSATSVTPGLATGGGRSPLWALSRAEKNREGTNIMRPKKRRPLILDRTPEARFRARAGRETPALERPHLSARRGVLAMWSLAKHITL